VKELAPEKLSIYNKLKGKVPFIYEDKNGLVGINGTKVRRILPEYERYSNYKKLMENEDNEQEIRRAFQKIRLLVEVFSKDKFIDLKEYIKQLEDDEVASYKSQIEEFENVYYRYIHNK